MATAEHFAARRGQIAAAREAAQESVAASQNKLTEAVPEFETYVKLAPEGANAATAKALIAQLKK